MTDASDIPKSSTQVAVDTLRQLIVENRLPAGSNHLESELAERLGMSRTPVREATIILQSEGLLDVKPRKGVTIRALSAADMTEIYQILTEIESLAAGLAAGREMHEVDLLDAQAAIDDMDDALKREDREAWAAADEFFHAALIALGGNRRIGKIVAMYQDQTRRARALTLHLRPVPTRSNEDHRAVLEAIRAGDAERARDIHRRHRIAAGETLVSLLDKYGFHHV